MLEDLGDRMHDSIESYLDAQLRPHSELPHAVLEQIRTETQNQLETIVDGVLGAVIAASRGAPLPPTVAPDLLAQFVRLLTSAGRADIQAFCDAVLQVRVAPRLVPPRAASCRARVLAFRGACCPLTLLSVCVRDRRRR
jgi:hypothetical protein